MTPPVSGRINHTPVTTPEGPAVTAPNARSPSSDFYIAAPTVSLPTDGSNPFISHRRLNKAGDALDVILKDFIGKHLVDARGKGAKVVMVYGSFPGVLNPELHIHQWDPDKKIDAVVWGDAEVMIRQLAESHGWNRPGSNSWWDRFNRDHIPPETKIRILGENPHRPRFDPAKHATIADFLVEYTQNKGLLYLPIQVKTPQGPVVAKVGLLDRGLWDQGFESDSNGRKMPRGDLMTSQRASLLPRTVGPGGTYHFINDQVDPGFLEQIRMVQADYARHALNSLADRDSFTGEELVARRYHIQFVEYDRTRGKFFNEAKKARMQLERYRASDPSLPYEILAPAFADALETVTAFEILLDGKRITPDQITPENLERVIFNNKRSPTNRQHLLAELETEFAEINRRLWPKTWFNVASGQYARPSPHAPNWLQYWLRKRGVLSNGSYGTPVRYAMDASRFSGTPEEIQRARLGHTGVPLNRNIIVAGYPPAHPSDLANGVNYAMAELQKGKKINPLIKGNSPSKFTFPLAGGVPVVAYRLMDGMMSPAIDEIIVSGTEDVRTIAQAFQEHYGNELKVRGTSLHIYEDAGSLPGNIKNGIDHPGREGRMSVLSFGDVPFADIHNVAFNPWRHHIDYIFGTNGRDVLLDFMGMNAHYAGEMEGVTYAFKEGNTQGVRDFNKVEMNFWSSIYNNRKSVTGKMLKVGIILGYFLRNPAAWTSFPGLFAHFLPRVARNMLYNKAGRIKHPTVIFSALPLFEYAFAMSLGADPEFRPNHIDPRSTLDVDGLRDYMLVRLMSELHPSPHQAKLESFVQETLMKPEYRDKLPALGEIHQIINRSFVDFYHGILDKQKQGLSWRLLSREAQEMVEKDLIRTLHENGFNPEILPFLEDAKMNPAWIEVGLPGETLEQAKKAMEAYNRRAEYAGGLVGEFLAWNEGEKRITTGKKVTPRIESFIQRRIDANPEYLRGLILENDFSKLQKAIVEAAEGKFGKGSFEVSEINRYFDISLLEKVDTPLRKILGGLKASDALRRYSDYMAPAEFQELYPKLVERLEQARSVVPGNRWLRSFPKTPLYDGKFLLRGFLDTALETADATFVRKVGESPPSLQKGWISKFLPQSHGHQPVQREYLKNGVESDTQGKIRRVDTAVWHPSDVDLFTRRVGVMPSRVPHMMAAASGAASTSNLHKVSEQRMTMERLLAWTNTEAGLKFLKQDPYRVRDTLSNRMHHGAVPLGFGLATLWGGEKLADWMGLDPATQPHERFMAVVGASHVVSQMAAAHHEVWLNQEELKAPFDFTKTRAVRMGRSRGIQYSLEARGNRLGASVASIGRNFPISGGPLNMAWQGVSGLGKFAVRTPWHMGSGLMSAALVDNVLSEKMLGLEQDSNLRRGIHFGAFFLPQMGEIAFGRKMPPAFSGPTMKFASRAFAVGFMADMAFLGVSRLSHGSERAVQNNMIYQQANELHDAEQNQGVADWFFDGAFELAAPSLAAWWDSVDFNGFSARPNHYQIQARDSLREFSEYVDRNASHTINSLLLQGTPQDIEDPGFYQGVNYGFLMEENSTSSLGLKENLPTKLFIRDMIQSSKFRDEFHSLRSLDQQVKFLQEQYSGYDLSRPEAEAMLTQTLMQRTRTDLGQLHGIPQAGNQEMRNLFNESGRLRKGREQALLKKVFRGEEMTEKKLLAYRRLGLAVQILRMREEGRADQAGKLQALENVSREIGLTDSQGNLVPDELGQMAMERHEAWRTARRENGIKVTHEDNRNYQRLQLYGES